MYIYGCVQSIWLPNIQHTHPLSPPPLPSLPLDLTPDDLCLPIRLALFFLLNELLRLPPPPAPPTCFSDFSLNCFFEGRVRPIASSVKLLVVVPIRLGPLLVFGGGELPDPRPLTPIPMDTRAPPDARELAGPRIRFAFTTFCPPRRKSSAPDIRVLPVLEAPLPTKLLPEERELALGETRPETPEGGVPPRRTGPCAGIVSPLAGTGLVRGELMALWGRGASVKGVFGSSAEHTRTRERSQHVCCWAHGSGAQGQARSCSGEGLVWVDQHAYVCERALLESSGQCQCVSQRRCFFW